MESRYFDFFKQTVLFATEDTPRHSEASIIELKDGSLLMAWQCHQRALGTESCSDEFPSNLSLMNSRDGARTWTDRRVVASMKDGCVNVYSPSFLRNTDGSISLFFRRYMQLEKNKTSLNNYYRIISFDEGVTWSEEETIWEMSDYGVMNHAIKRISDGSVLLPMDGGPEGGWVKGANEKVYVLRTDDKLSSRTASNILTLPMRGVMEPCIAERSDGVLNMVMRNQLGSVFYSESYDKGITWTKPQTTGLRAPESCPCLVSIPGTDAQLVIWNNSEYDMRWRSHYGKRTPLTMAISCDGLKTFTDYFDIETDPGRAFTNPSVTVTTDGLFIMNYWTCRYDETGLMSGPIDLKLATFRIGKDGLCKQKGGTL